MNFVIAKLHRGTEIDLDDAVLVARHFHLFTETIQAGVRDALASSPQDTALFLFRKQSISSTGISFQYTRKERVRK